MPEPAKRAVGLFNKQLTSNGWRLVALINPGVPVPPPQEARPGAHCIRVVDGRPYVSAIRQRWIASIRTQAVTYRAVRDLLHSWMCLLGGALVHVGMDPWIHWPSL